MNLPKRESGQALLIVLLIMFVGLTISLTLISRTTTDIKFSRELEESSKALAAAEAGIEESLRQGIAVGSGEIAQGVTYSVTSAPAGGGSGVFSLGKIEKESVGTIFFVNHNSDGSLNETRFFSANKIRLCWNKAETTFASIEAVVLYKDGAVYKVARNFFNPSGVVGGGEDCGDPSNSLYPNKVNISLPEGSTITLLALRLKPIGADALLAVDPPGDNSLPSQGTEFISTGKVGDTVRKIKVIKSYPTWPEVFDYVLFSGGGLNK